MDGSLAVTSRSAFSFGYRVAKSSENFGGTGWELAGDDAFWDVDR